MVTNMQDTVDSLDDLLHAFQTLLFRGTGIVRDSMNACRIGDLAEFRRKSIGSSAPNWESSAHDVTTEHFAAIHRHAAIRHDRYDRR